MARDQQDDDRHVNEALAALGRQVAAEPVSDKLRTLALRLEQTLKDQQAGKVLPE